jgi:hypothetical protein
MDKKKENESYGISFIKVEKKKKTKPSPAKIAKGKQAKHPSHPDIFDRFHIKHAFKNKLLICVIHTRTPLPYTILIHPILSHPMILFLHARTPD